MLHFFNTKERVRFLLFVAAIAAPLIVGAAFLVSWLEASSAASGEPNARGGLHYRIQDERGTDTTFPAALAAVIRPYPGAAHTDVSADTDGTGELDTAAVVGQTTDDIGKVAAYFAGPGRVPQRADAKRRYNISVVDFGAGTGVTRKFRVGVRAQ